jgi:YD repeat-containing protein
LIRPELAGFQVTGDNNSFTNVAQNIYGLGTTNTFTVNLPQSVNLAYDRNGNLTNDGTRTFTYDTENQLTNVFVTNLWRSDFAYDGLGRRRIVREFAWQSGAWVKTNEVRILYDGYLPIQERDTNNNVLVRYTRGIDLNGDLWDAGGIGGLLARTDANGSTFYHSDGSGNVTALMDGNEDIVARYLYNPFGKLIGQWE